MNETIRGLALFFFLYSIQGLIYGYMQSLSFTIQEKTHNFAEQSLLAVVQWPCFLKFIFAPFLDYYFSYFIGKRKTYIIPSSIIAGISLILYANSADELIENDKIRIIVCFFFIIQIMIAVQDAAIDGWMAEKLEGPNTQYSGIIQTIGVVIGSYISGHLFLIVNGKEFKEMIGYQSLNPIFTHQDLLKCIGIYMIIVSMIVLIFVHEKISNHHDFESVWEIYQLFPRLVSNKNVKKSLLYIATNYFGIQIFDVICPLAVIQAGFPKEVVAEILSVMVFIQLIPTVICSFIQLYGKYIKSLCVLGLAEIIMRTIGYFLYFFIFFTNNQNYQYWLLFIILALSATSWTRTSLVTSFISSIGDQHISGTYMTLMYAYVNFIDLSGETIIYFVSQYVPFEYFAFCGIIYTIIYYTFFAKYFMQLDLLPRESFSVIKKEDKKSQQLDNERPQTMKKT